MKKLLILLIFAIIIGCSNTLKPIEKYKGKVIVDINGSFEHNIQTTVLLKNQDSIIKVQLLKFDLLNYKVGDTIR